MEKRVRNIFAFLRQSADPLLEREFRELYQEPNVRYARYGCVLAIVGFGGFHLMDVAAGRTPAMDWAGAARLAITLYFVAATIVVTYWRAFVTRHYTLVANLFFLVAVHGAALLPIAVHGVVSPPELYWSLNASLVTAIIVTYGFSRLTAKNTALVILSGCATGLVTATLSPGFDLYYFGRLVLHLAIVNIAAFSLRQSIERRERQLFLLARENLRRNIYAQELEATKSRAVEADMVKMRFLANMSHEFRTPMSGVVQTLEVVKRTATGEVASLVARAIESSNAFLGTINSILDYTRWSDGAVPVSLSSVGLSALIRRVIARHTTAISRRGLALHLRLDLTASEDYVRTDEVLLTEIFSHVLDNAVKFTEVGRLDFGVELRSRAGAGAREVFVEVMVSDSGIGIPADLQPLLGTAFYQVDNASNRKEGGAGLGLAIVSRLVSALDGTWSLSSIEGSGTVVRLSIPAERASPPPGSQARRFLDSGQRNVEKLRGRVLLVEDNELNAALAKDLLGIIGLDVTLALDGRQAVAEVSARPFDIVLMDCQMPVMDGFAATRAIRADERDRGSRRIPIVAVTANALAGDRENCLAAGMDDHLAKPYTAAQLREVLATWLSPDNEAGISDGASTAVS
jgi:signal transduction histidine kinase/CheY-like chemotaxis protein